jgi:hypothetical protein
MITDGFYPTSHPSFLAFCNTQFGRFIVSNHDGQANAQIQSTSDVCISE